MKQEFVSEASLRVAPLIGHPAPRCPARDDRWLYPPASPRLIHSHKPSCSDIALWNALVVSALVSAALLLGSATILAAIIKALP